MAEAAVSQLAVYRSRPTVRIDSQEFEKVRELIIAMGMKEEEGGMSALELRLSNVASDPQGDADFAFENEDEFSLGANITVYAGDENEAQEIFNGVITGLEAEFPGRNLMQHLLNKSERTSPAADHPAKKPPENPCRTNHIKAEVILATLQHQADIGQQLLE